MRRSWTASELDYLREHYASKPTWELAIRLEHSESSVYQKANDLGLKKAGDYLKSAQSGRLQPGERRGKATEFTPGQTPWNKGKTGWTAGGRSAQTRFKPGCRPHTWQPIGTIRISTDGYTQIKLTDTGPSRKDWRNVHHLIWEQHHGPIQPGQIIIFVDNDRRNLAIENLTMVSRGELAILNRSRFAHVEPQLRLQAINIARLKYAAGKASRRRNGTHTGAST